jgi:hypothetical protein
MEIIVHRRNTILELDSTPKKYGVEVDIRSYGPKLIVNHDPYIEGESFEQWLTAYRHGTLILNLKEEGLEEKLSTLMHQYGISDYFFLDQSFPFLVKYSSLGHNRAAVRVSEYESINTALSFAGRVDWAWIDCFNQFPLTATEANRLTDAGFKLCLVSPELQGRDAATEIPLLQSLLTAHSINAHAVCTKRPDLWEM